MNQVQVLANHLLKPFQFSSNVVSKAFHVLALTMKLSDDRLTYYRAISNRSLSIQERRRRVIPLFLKNYASVILIVAGTASTWHAVKNFFIKHKLSATNGRLNTLYRRAQLSQAVVHLLDLTLNHDIYSLEERSRGQKTACFHGCSFNS